MPRYFFTVTYSDKEILPMLIWWVPVAMLGCAGVGGAVGLIADLRVLLVVCQLIVAAAVPLLHLVLWPEFALASQRDERDELSHA
jgi:hypothetical protein